MTTIKFTDGMKFNVEAAPHVEKRKDGWYAVGNGMLCPEESYEAACQTVEEWKKQEG